MSNQTPSSYPIGLTDANKSHPPLWLYYNKVDSYTPSRKFRLSIAIDGYRSKKPRRIRLLIGYDQRLFSDLYVAPSREQEYQHPGVLQSRRTRAEVSYRNPFQNLSRNLDESDDPPITIVLSLEYHHESSYCSLRLRDISLCEANVKWRIAFDHTHCSNDQAFYLSLDVGARMGTRYRTAWSSWTCIRIIPSRRSRSSSPPDLPPHVIKSIMHFFANMGDVSWDTMEDLSAILECGLVCKRWLAPAQEIFLQTFGHSELARIPNPIGFARYLVDNPQLAQKITLINTRNFRLSRIGRPGSPQLGMRRVRYDELLPVQYKAALRSIMASCPCITTLRTVPSYLALLSPVLPGITTLRILDITFLKEKGFEKMDITTFQDIVNTLLNLEELVIYEFERGRIQTKRDMKKLAIPLESLVLIDSMICRQILLGLLPTSPHGLRMLDLDWRDIGSGEISNQDLEDALKSQSHSLEKLTLRNMAFRLPLKEGEMHALESVLPEMVALRELLCVGGFFSACIFSRKLDGASDCRISVRRVTFGILFNETLDIGLAEAMEMTGWNSIAITFDYGLKDTNSIRKGLTARQIINRAKEIAERRGISLSIRHSLY